MAEAEIEPHSPKEQLMPRLTITVVNKDNEPLAVEWHECKVKVKGGLWARLAKNTNTDTIQPGQMASTVYDATFGAEANRRYQIAINNGDSDAVVYYPSNSTWTTDSTPMINVQV